MNDPISLFDFSYLEIMAAGDPAMHAELISILREQLPEDHHALEEAISSGQLTQIFEASHRLKSTLAFTGNEEAIAWNSEIEKNARLNHDVARFSEAWQSLHSRLKTMEIVLRSMP
ncbi:MAG: Hpt domain-containing protein [Saprospiraceae bacterium]|jgi:HPt (histidine-containing phosphotransfer) domain-containing protein|nr:Hpt domain-containing protein [Saprospiraceae bacterium]